MKYVTTILFSALDDADAADRAQRMAQEIPGAGVKATLALTHPYEPVELRPTP